MISLNENHHRRLLYHDMSHTLHSLWLAHRAITIILTRNGISSANIQKTDQS